MTHEELTQLLRGDDEPGNEMERACFDFVRAASQNHGGAPDELYGRLAAQLTAPQIVALRVPIEAHLAGDTGYVLA